MTIDEAIRHCEEVAEIREAEVLKYNYCRGMPDVEKTVKNCKECAADHRQLAEWLTELKDLREKHWNECRQIAHYDDELQKLMIPAITAALDNLDANDMIRELKKLLKIAMADLREAEDCSCCIFDSKQCPGVTGDCTFKWKHHDEAIELMGGENI